jgi:hypothetical protein
MDVELMFFTQSEENIVLGCKMKIKGALADVGTPR